jgi:hypothetical protein
MSSRCPVTGGPSMLLRLFVFLVVVLIALAIFITLTTVSTY